MKKILFIILFSLMTFIGNAQIYNTIKHYDKFDDVVKTEKIKTIVNIYYEDNYRYKPIIIETKNKKPETYYIIYKDEAGKKDSLIDLTGKGVYGYEINYICVKDTLFLKTIREEILEDLYNNDLTFYSAYLQQDTLLCLMKFFNKENIYFLSKNLELLENGRIKEPIYFLTNRYVSRFKYRWEYDDQLFWIRKNDGSRIIYSNE